MQPPRRSSGGFGAPRRLRDRSPLRNHLVFHLVLDRHAVQSEHRDLRLQHAGKTDGPAVHAREPKPHGPVERTTDGTFLESQEPWAALH